MKFDIKRFLEGFGKETQKKIVQKIIKVGAVKTGNLKKSIAYNIIKKGDSYEIEFSMIDYGQYVDEGTEYIKPREFFVKVIEQYIEKVFDEVMDEAIEQELEKIFR